MSESGQNNNNIVQPDAFAYAGNVRPREDNDADHICSIRYRTHNGHEIRTEPAQTDNPSHTIPANYSVVTVGDMMNENAISM